MRVVICGGGIIGASVAYFLATHGVQCTVLERLLPACAASGKAGGFLARDWCDSSELGPLAQLSFDLHSELAQVMKDSDYRRMETLSIQVKEGTATAAAAERSGLLPDWLDGNIPRVSVLGTTETTAQVHPYKLTHSLLKAAASMTGTVVRQAVVTGISVVNSRVIGVNIDNSETIPADVVVIAMGPWSSQAAKWFDGEVDLPVTGSPAHSIILQPRTPVTAHALFTTFRQHAKNIEPEIYPRPDGTVYVCGSGAKLPLPDDPQVITSNEQDAASLHQVARCASSVLGTAEIITSTSCYLPNSPDGLPIIGKIPHIEGAYVAAGHGCWGILGAPATGKCLAELIMTGACSLLDLSPFDPARFTTKLKSR
jgi:glycine/D-amino acid oxidase-like deaminating enzyme